MVKENNDKLSIEVLFYLLHKNKKFLFIFNGTVILIAIVYSLLATHWYKSQVTIIPSPGDKNASILDQFKGVASMVGIDLNSGMDIYAFFPDIIYSNYVIDKLIDQKYNLKEFDEPISLYGLWQVDTTLLTDHEKYTELEKARKKLRTKYIFASIDQKTGILNLIVEAPTSPELAANLANSITTYLNQYLIQYSHSNTIEQINYIKKSIKNTKEDLKRTSVEFKEFLDKNLDRSSPAKTMQYEMLKAKWDMHSSLNNELNRQLKMAEIEKIKNNQIVNVLQYATPAIERSFPKRSIIVILSAIFGALFSIAIIIIRVRYIPTLLYAYRNVNEQ
jgi:uncharacterized protein involved in exopolysaccharide biosynthesis